MAELTAWGVEMLKYAGELLDKVNEWQQFYEALRQASLAARSASSQPASSPLADR